jgi:hypothetical protein
MHTLAPLLFRNKLPFRIKQKKDVMCNVSELLMWECFILNTGRINNKFYFKEMEHTYIHIVTLVFRTVR